MQVLTLVDLEPGTIDVVKDLKNVTFSNDWLRLIPVFIPGRRRQSTRVQKILLPLLPQHYFSLKWTFFYSLDFNKGLVKKSQI